MSAYTDHTLGIKKEAVYGTAITVDRHFAFISSSLKQQLEFIQGQGIQAGSSMMRASRRRTSKVTAGGSIELEGYSRGLGTLLEAALGTVTSTQIAASTAYQQVHTEKRDARPSFTIQVGVVPGEGVAQPHTFVGSVCESLELSCDNAGFLRLATEWKCKEMLTATALAAPTFPSATNGQIWSFLDASIVLGGSVTPPTTTTLATGGTPLTTALSASLKIERNTDDGGFYYGGDGKRGRANYPGALGVSGQIVVDYTDNTIRDAYLAQSDLGLILKWAGSTAIAASNFPTIQAYCPLVRLDGDTPVPDASNPAQLTIPFTALDKEDGNPSFYLSYVTADTAV